MERQRHDRPQRFNRCDQATAASLNLCLEKGQGSVVEVRPEHRNRFDRELVVSLRLRRQQFVTNSRPTLVKVGMLHKSTKPGQDEFADLFAAAVSVRTVLAEVVTAAVGQFDPWREDADVANSAVDVALKGQP